MREECFIDWMSYTLPADTKEDVLRVAAETMRRLGDGHRARVSRYGYESAYEVLGCGRVLFSEGRPDMGVHVEMPSTALAELPGDLVEHMADVKARGGKFARIDVAMDTDAVTVSECARLKDEGLLVTNLRTDWMIVDRLTGAETLYLGGTSPHRRAQGEKRGKSATSRRQVRIYDKGLESETEEAAGHLTRIEVVLRSQYADAAGAAVLDGASLESLIVGAIDFRDRPEMANVTNRPRSQWWSDLLGTVKKVKLGHAKVIETVERAQEFVKRQAMPSIAKICVALGSTEWIRGQLELAVNGLRPDQWTQAQRWGSACSAFAV